MTATHTDDLTWKAVSDPVCREILDLLREEPLTTTALCDSFGDLTRFKIMNHMSTLKKAGLIHVEQRGRERVNHLVVAPLRDIYDDWLREFEALWAGRLSRLKRTVEQKQRKQIMNTKPAFPEAPVPLDICFDVEIEASASAVFAGLTEDIGEWWGAPYLQGNSAVDVVLDAKPGGLMLERAKGDDGAIWAFVQEIHRDRFLALEGRMHMAPAVYARTTFKLAEHGGRTQLSFAQHAVGHFNSRHGEIFAEGWRDLLGKRLKDFVEHGLSSGVRSAKETVR